MAPLQIDGRSMGSCFVVLLVAGMLLADMFVGVYVVLNGREKTTQRWPAKKKSWCVKCQGFRDVDDFRHGELCCAENSTTNVAILNKIYADGEQKDELLNIPATVPERRNRYLRPHAHLQGTKLIRERIGNEYLATVETWYDDKEGSSKIQNGVILRHGRLVAPLSGLYLIYTHIDFTEQHLTSDLTKRGIEHKIFRFNILHEEEGEELLFGRVLSRCKPRKQGERSPGNEEYGSYVMAMVHLKAGDEISVRVTNIKFLSNNPSSHYFGMHML